MVVSIEQQIPDIRLLQNRFFPKYSITYDYSLKSNGTLDDSQALATAVMIALGTNALAAPDDVLPDPDSSDREGWWGDMDADTIWGAWPIGSKLWLLRRAKINSVDSIYGSTLTAATNYIYNCIQPFVDQKICTSFMVETVRVDTQRIDALIRIFRGPTASIDLRYEQLWDNIRETNALVNPYISAS
jgi:phage gp46-like protein